MNSFTFILYSNFCVLCVEVELRAEGIDVHKVKDPLFMFNFATKTYEPFGPAELTNIISGKAKL